MNRHLWCLNLAVLIGLIIGSWVAVIVLVHALLSIVRQLYA